MKISALILLSLVVLVYSQDQIKIIPNRKSLIPLNFVQAIQNINAKIEYSKKLKEYQIDYWSFSEIFDEIKNLNFQNAQIPFPNVSSDCLTQFTSFVLAFSSKQPWTIQLLDSFGKPPSGILQGALFWAGEYSECVNVTEKSFNGKYCTISKPVDINPQNVQLSFKYGICMPSFCNNEDISNLINFGIFILPNITQLVPFNLSFINSSYVTCVEAEPLDTEASWALSILLVLISLVVIGTIYDLFKQHTYNNQLKYIYSSTIIHTETGSAINNDEKEKIIQTYQSENESSLMKILLGFSIYTNSKKLFNVTKNDDQLQCIHAIRFLSISWVILGHVYAFQISYLDDLIVINEWIQRFSFMVVSNAFFSVDSFFLLSGLLTSYLFLKETSKRKPSLGFMSKYYLHRIWRLTPPYMLVLMISATLTKYLGKGPMYPKDGFEINKCQDTWWTNLLYINNLVKTDQSCLAVSWYLANDMQFYVFAPIVLIPLALGKKVLGFSICLLILAGNIICTALIINHYPGSELGMLSTNPNYFNKVYITPWCRIGPYVVGIITGYLILHFKKKEQFKMKFETNLLLWFLSLTILGLMLFGIYPNLNGEPLSVTANILYQASSRTIWAIGLAYIIFACVTSHGGFVNKILCWTVWTPLSRLSYCLYLFHAIVLLYYNSVQDHPIHAQDSNTIFNFISCLVVSLACSFFVSMIFEIPLLGIERILLKKK